MIFFSPGLNNKTSLQMVKKLPDPSHPEPGDDEQPCVGGQQPLGGGGEIQRHLPRRGLRIRIFVLITRLLRLYAVRIKVKIPIWTEN